MAISRESIKFINRLNYVCHGFVVLENLGRNNRYSPYHKSYELFSSGFYEIHFKYIKKNFYS